MIIDIIIDYREIKLYNEIINRDLDKFKDNINILKENLEIGDIHIKFNDTLYIYERKTINDLMASIKDNRYKEQKFRMLNNHKNNNYIIEGDNIISSNNNNNQNILSGVYLHSIYRDNINIFFTKNINETATFILILATKICTSPDKFINKDNQYPHPDNQDKQEEYIDNVKIKSKKIDNIDKETCYLLQLSQIPYISKKISKNICNIYPTMRDLLRALDNSDNKKKLLMDIENIGETKANKILEYFNYVY